MQIVKSVVLIGMLCLISTAQLTSCAGGSKQVREMTSEDYFKQAQEFVTSEKFTSAKECLEKARGFYRSGDADARLLALLGDVQYELKEYYQAITVYEDFLKLHPRNMLAAHVQYQIGMSYFHLIRPRDRDPQPAYQAQETFTRVMENYPRSPEARDAAGRIQETRRHLAESEFFVGKFYFRKKNYHGAIGRFETVLSDYAGLGLEEETLYHLGESYRLIEDTQKAQEYFSLLLERFPTGKHTDRARDFLAERRG